MPVGPSLSSPRERNQLPARSALTRSAAILVLATALAGALSVLVWRFLSEELDVRTDVVGYPIYHNFNINRYLWFYWLIVAIFPIATLAIFLALSRLVNGPVARSYQRRALARAAPTPPASPAVARAVGLARVAFVGSVLGIEVSLTVERHAGWIAGVALPALVVYGACLATLSLALGRLVLTRCTFWERLAAANALGVAALVALLYGVSRATDVFVSSADAVHPYPWFPAWLAAAGTCLALAWVVKSAWRATGDQLRELERRTLLFVAGPVALFLFLAAIPANPGPMDMFQEGETLVPARLVAAGAFPWRDLLVIHGPLADVFKATVGLQVLEDSRWGFVAGQTLLLFPLGWLSLYYLCAYLFRRSWLFLVGTQLAVVLGVVSAVEFGWIMQPLVLLLLAALLAKPTRIRAAAFVVLLAVQAVAQAETGVAVIACIGTVVVFELYYYDRTRPFLANFRRTAFCFLMGAFVAAAWFAFLLSQHAHDDFLFAYRAFGADHHLVAGIPVRWVDGSFVFAAVAPVVLVLLTFVYFVAKTRLRSSLRVEEWVMAATAITVLLYYHKFVTRADGHVYQPFAVTLPLLFYALYRVNSFLQAGLERVTARIGWGWRLPSNAVTVIGLILLLAFAPVPPTKASERIPARFSVTVAEPAAVARLGFADPAEPLRTIQPAPPGRVGESLIRDLRHIMTALLDPGDTVFDFSNNPGLFHYLLEQPSPTRYYNVGIATKRRAQTDLVHELERARPEFVVYSSDWLGLPAWDGIPNSVRHYDISKWILDRYTPILYSHGFLLMARDGARASERLRFRNLLEQPVTEGLHFRTFACDWGYAPNFLSTSPASTSRVAPLAFKSLGTVVRISGWAIDRAARRPSSDVLAVIGGRVVHRVKPSLERPDVAAELRDSAFLRSGFEMAVVLPGARARAKSSGIPAIHVYALSSAGEASELDYTADARWITRGEVASWRVLDLRRGRSVPVVMAPGSGFVGSDVAAQSALTIDLPRSVRPEQFDWLEIEAGSPLGENRVVLSDTLGDPRRAIAFRTLPNGRRTVRVEIGACSQWHGYERRRLRLGFDRAEDVRAIRLLR